MKVIKRLFQVIFVLALVVMAASCEFGAKKQTPTLAAESSQFTLYVGDKFEPLKGVTATGTKGEDVLDQVEVSTLTPVDENGCVTQSGTYDIKYVLTIDGEKYNLYRQVIVIYVLPETDSLIVNGDFEEGVTDPFTKSEFDNGAASLSVVKEGNNHVLKVEVISRSWQEASPRVETNVFEMTAGTYYEVSFKARAEQARTIYVQVGQLISDNPWFYQIAGEYFDLTEEMQEFKFNIVSDGTGIIDLTKIQVLFGFGTVHQGTSCETTCYLDDIKVEEATLESLLKVESIYDGLGEETRAVENPEEVHVWYDQGGWIGAPVVATYSLEDGVTTITSNQSAGACWFATQMFLYSNALEGGNYTLSFKLNMDVAGTITYGVNDGVNSAVKKETVAVSQGDNQLTLTFDILAEKSAGLSIQFGADGSGNMGAFTAQVSDILLIRNGDTVFVDYADPTNLFGTVVGAVNGDETQARANPNTFYVWYVQSADWDCGPVVQCSFDYQNDKLSVNANLNNTHYWFATQIFYYTKVIEAAGSHTLTFTLTSDTAGQITINGVKTTIVVGDNTITVPFTNAANSSFGLSIQLGWEEITPEGQDNISHQLIGDNHLVLKDFTIDNQGVATGDELLGLPVNVTTGGENDAKANPGVFYLWTDQWWCGSQVIGTITYDDGEVVTSITSVTGDCVFGSQLFYYGVTVEEASTLSFTLNSTVSMTVELNGEEQNIVVGDNNISLNFAAGAQIKIVMVVSTEYGPYVFQYSDFALA